MSSHRRLGSAPLAVTLVAGVMFADAACFRPQGSVDSNSQALPVDAARVDSVQAANWPHHRSIEIDLNGDDSVEHLVLASDVQLSTSGVPLWEDGHRWAVSVGRLPAGTLVYGAFVPNGHVEVAVLSPDAQGRRNVLVHERTPARARSIVISYLGHGDASTVADTNFQIESWLPDLRSP
jgi:hypothetical protein